MEICDLGKSGEGHEFRFSTEPLPVDENLTRFDAPIFVGGQYWTLSIIAEAGSGVFWAVQAESWSLLGIGLVATGFIVLWMRQRQMYVTSVESQVMDRTAALSRINADLENEMKQRRLAETNLIQSENRFREAFLHAPIGIGLASPAGDWMQVNEALVKMSGFSAEELQRLTMADMLHPDEASQELARIGQILAGEIDTFALEQRFRHKSGHFIWVSLNVSQVRDEDQRLLYFVCQILDITERKEALEQTRRAQQFSENIIKSSIDGILSFDRAGRFTVWNCGMERMTGIPAKDALGRSADKVLPFLGEDDEKSQAFRRVLAGEEVRSAERPFAVPSSGRSGFYTAHLSPLQDNEGGITGGVAIVHDVSVEREARERLQASTELLKQRNRELQDFAYVASHDLQEPLRKIRAFGDRLEKKCDGGLDDQAADCLRRMLDAARRMQILIADLLAFSRVSTEASGFTPIDLGVVVREVLSDLETGIDETSAQLEIGPLPTIAADPTQMRQLFQNLIGNGLKYHRSEAPPRIRLYATDLSGHDDLPALVGPGFLIHFEDNGIGFDEKYLDRIFTVFQRLHGRHEYPGTGVGLAICRRIVERHHGWITARSTPGSGSTFIVALPEKQPTMLA